MQDLGRLGFSEDQATLLDVATSFCASRSPMAKVRRLIEDETGHDPDVWREIVELGWLGIAIPEEHGGAGLGLAEVVPVMEQMGRHMLAGPFLSTTLAAQALLAGGTEDQKRVLLPRLAGGAIATLALCEANDDWDLGNIASTATRTSSGTLRLSGSSSTAASASPTTATPNFIAAGRSGMPRSTATLAITRPNWPPFCSEAGARSQARDDCNDDPTQPGRWRERSR